MNAWLILLLAIAAEVVATSMLKMSENFTRLGPSIIVVLGYAAAFYLLALTLRTLPVGIAYAVWAGVGVVIVTVVAWIFYGQTLDMPALLGIGLIIAGVVVMNLFSKSVGH